MFKKRRYRVKTKRGPECLIEAHDAVLRPNGGLKFVTGWVREVAAFAPGEWLWFLEVGLESGSSKDEVVK